MNFKVTFTTLLALTLGVLGLNTNVYAASYSDSIIYNTNNIDVNISYDLTKNSDSFGYAGAIRYTPQANEILIDGSQANFTNPDVFSYTLDITQITEGYAGKVRLKQALTDYSGNVNNEASLYTISWTGGEGNATYSDTATPSPDLYRYGKDLPTTFDINEREIKGLETEGEIVNGGNFTVYQTYNQLSEWYVDFPLGVTSVTVKKETLKGGVCDYTTTADTTITANPECGIDANYPLYGKSAGVGSGESFREFLVFQISAQDIIAPTGTINPNEDTTIVSPEISGTVDDPTALVSVTINGQTYEAVNNGDGTWTLAAGTIAPLTAGQTYPINVNFVDDTGNSTTADSTVNILRLDSDIPVVNTFTSSTGEDVVLTGTFDSVNSTSFKVEVNGVVYTLGASPALSADANNWTLDLTNLSFANGLYSVVATSSTRGGNDVVDQTNNELNVAIPAPVSSQNSVFSSSTVSSLSSSLNSSQNRGALVQTGINLRPVVVGLLVLLVLVGFKVLRSENK